MWGELRVIKLTEPNKDMPRREVSGGKVSLLPHREMCRADSRTCLSWASNCHVWWSASHAMRFNVGIRYPPGPRRQSSLSCPSGCELHVMQGFWRRTKPWQPSKQPRPHPPDLGPALEWTFRDNMEEIVSVQSIFLDQGELWTPPPARSVAAQASSPRKTPAPIATVPEKMQLAYLLNASPAVPRPPAPEAMNPVKRSTTPENAYNEPAQALKRHRSSL